MFKDLKKHVPSLLPNVDLITKDTGIQQQNFSSWMRNWCTEAAIRSVLCKKVFLEI